MTVVEVEDDVLDVDELVDEVEVVSLIDVLVLEVEVDWLVLDVDTDVEVDRLVDVDDVDVLLVDIDIELDVELVERLELVDDVDSEVDALVEDVDMELLVLEVDRDVLDVEIDLEVLVEDVDMELEVEEVLVVAAAAALNVATPAVQALDADNVIAELYAPVDETTLLCNALLAPLEAFCVRLVYPLPSDAVADPTAFQFTTPTINSSACVVVAVLPESGAVLVPEAEAVLSNELEVTIPENS